MLYEKPVAPVSTPLHGIVYIVSHKHQLVATFLTAYDAQQCAKDLVEAEISQRRYSVIYDGQGYIIRLNNTPELRIVEL